MGVGRQEATLHLKVKITECQNCGSTVLFFITPETLSNTKFLNDPNLA